MGLQRSTALVAAKTGFCPLSPMNKPFLVKLDLSTFIFGLWLLRPVKVILHRPLLHGTIGDSRDPLFGFSNLPNQLRTLETCFTHNYQFITRMFKRYNEQPDRKINKARSRRVLRAEDSVPVKFGVPSKQMDIFTKWEALRTQYFKDFYGSLIS